MLLLARRASDLVIAGGAAISCRSYRGELKTQLLETLADALVRNFDVDPLTCIA